MVPMHACCVVFYVVCATVCSHGAWAGWRGLCVCAAMMRGQVGGDCVCAAMVRGQVGGDYVCAAMVRGQVGGDYVCVQPWCMGRLEGTMCVQP